MNVLAILGHPRPGSLNGALCEAYVEGARQSGAHVETLRVADLAFQPNVLHEDILEQPDEPDIVRARRLIRWADHIVFVYPGWWGTMPALLKGFLDRVLTPGFAFEFYGEGSGWRKHLKGRTAEIISTLDMPPWVFRVFYRQPGSHALARSTLGFTGIRTTRITHLGPVRESTPEERRDWLGRVRELGRSLAHGVDTPAGRLRESVRAWLKAARLHFYPMAWVAYTVGALMAAGAPRALDTSVYVLGILFLFFLEAATVLANEYFDYETDRINGRYGPFNGGSRVLVEGDLTFRQVLRGMAVCLVLAGAFLGMVLVSSPGAWPALGVLAGLLALVALGYTVPPLKLSHRTLGEIDVGLTHSLGVILCGYLLQGGSWTDPAPYLVSLPLFLGTLPAIILAGIPDRDADRKAGKRTIAVRFGRRNAVSIALALTAAAATSAGLMTFHGEVGALYRGGVLLIVGYGAFLTWLLRRRLRRFRGGRPFDGLIAASLVYLVCFGVVPLAALVQQPVPRVAEADAGGTALAVAPVTPDEHGTVRRARTAGE